MESKEKTLWITAKDYAKFQGKSREAIGKAARAGKMEYYVDRSKGGKGVRLVRIEGEEVDQYLKAELPKEPSELSKRVTKVKNPATIDLNEGYSDKAYQIGLQKARVCSVINKEINKKVNPIEQIYEDIAERLPEIAMKLLNLLNKDQVSTRSLKRWTKKYNESGHDFTVLMPKYKKIGEGKRAITNDEYHMLLKLLFNPNKMKIGTAVRIIKQNARAGEITSPSSKYVLKRAAEDLKVEFPSEWHLIRDGENSFKNKILKPVRRDNSSLQVGERWVSDGKKLDYYIINPETGKPDRMIIISIMDEASKYIVGFALGTSEDTKTIAMAFRSAVLNNGKPPKSIYIDNGRAYKSNYYSGKKKKELDQNSSDLVGLFERLGTDIITAERFNAKAKSIERLYRTFHEDFEQQQPSFVGSSPSSKPATMLAAENWIKEQFTIEILTLAEAQKALNKYFTEYYAKTPHSGLNGKTPHDVYMAGKPNNTMDIRKLDYLMLEQKIRTVSKQGIRIFNTHYYSTELIHHIGAKVIVKYDLWDTSYIKVYDTYNRFICDAYKSGLQASILESEANINNLNNERAEQKKILADTKNTVEKLLQENRDSLEKNIKRSDPPKEATNLFSVKENSAIQISEKEKIINLVKSFSGVFTVADIAQKIKTNHDTTRKVIKEYEGDLLECIGENSEGIKMYVSSPKSNDNKLRAKKKQVDWEEIRSRGTVGKNAKDIILKTVQQLEFDFTSHDIKDKTGFELRKINRNLKILKEEGIIRLIGTNALGELSYIKESNPSSTNKNEQIEFNFDS